MGSLHSAILFIDIQPLNIFDWFGKIIIIDIIITIRQRRMYRMHADSEKENADTKKYIYNEAKIVGLYCSADRLFWKIENLHNSTLGHHRNAC